MNKRKAALWIVLFLIIVATPHFSYFFLGQYVDSENYENRNLKEKPVWTTDDYEEYSENYENYYNDNIPFRNQLIKLNNSIDYYVFKQSSSDRVLIGNEGWFFYCDKENGNPVEQSLGYTNYSDEELSTIAENLKLCQKSLEFLGIEFVIFIAPNKESIYTDKIPSYYKRHNEISNAEQLVNYLRENTDIRIVYPKKTFEEIRTVNPSLLLYHKLDTHWNNAGAYIGAASLAKELGLEMPAIDELSCAPVYGNSGDLTNMLNITIKDGNVNYYLDGFSTFVTEVEKYDSSTEIIFHTTGGADTRKLFIFRDSFSEALAPYIASQFENSKFVFRRYFDQHQIFDYGADIFVLESVERYIDEMITLSISYAAVNTEIADGKKNITISKSIPDVDLEYVSIRKINGANQETETIQELESFLNDKHITVDAEEEGKLVIEVFDDDKGENLINRTIAAY